MELPVDVDVKNWRIPEVVDWLKQYSMQVYADDFRDHYVDGEKLLNLSDGRLRELNVHPKHIKQMLKAIKIYRDHNPDNDYEFASDPDDFGDDDEDEIDDSNDSYPSYIPPDEIEEVRSQNPYRAPAPPEPEEPEESYEDFYHSDEWDDDQGAMYDGVSDYIPPTRYINGASQVPDPEITPPPRPQKTNIAPRRAPHQQQAPQQIPHQQQKPAAPTPTPPTGKAFRPVPTPPPSNGSGHLSSLPDTQAPLPPPHNISRPRGNRPAAPLPNGKKTAPHGENISTEPRVPLLQSLDEEQINYEVVEEPQEDYEVVDEVGSHNSSNSLGRSPARGGPLPKTPSDDEESSGGSLSSPFKGGMSLPRKGVPGRTQYPLVTLPDSRQGSNAVPATTKKKVIQSYTVHNLPQSGMALSTSDAPPPLSSRPTPGNNIAPTLGKPLPVPPKDDASASTTQFLAKSYPSRQQALPQPTESPATECTTSQDTSGMSVKERMRLLQFGNGSGVPRPPTGGSKPLSIMDEMMKKQNDWKNTSAVSIPGRDVASNSGAGSPIVGQSRTDAPSKPASIPIAVAAPRTITAVRSPLNPSPPPIPTSSHPQISMLPSAKKPKDVVPAIPNSSRPSHRESECSNLSADDGRGLYSYHWYRSDTDRSRSMAVLNKRRGEKGVFIVRKSMREPSKPYTLDVIYDEHDFHIPLRKREDGHFAMGNPQAAEDHWASVPELVEYFRTHNLALTRKVNGVTIKRSTLLIN